MSRIFQMVNAPTTAEYVRGLSLLGERVTEAHIRLFQAHYRVEKRASTASRLANLAGIEGRHPVVNSLYGKLGHAFCDVLGIKPQLRPDDTYRWWSVWSRGWNTPEGFVWEMLPQVAEALEQLGWVELVAFVSPDEVPAGTQLVEGGVSRITVNAYERNTKAREQCIAAHGANCCICGFNFGAVYGEIAEGYIHVHHLRPLSETGGEYVVNPIEDLRPVCPNCHAVLHLDGQCRRIEELKQLLTEQHE